MVRAQYIEEEMKKRRKQEDANFESDESKPSSTSFTIKDFALASLMGPSAPKPSPSSSYSRQSIGIDLSVVTEVELNSERDKKNGFVKRDKMNEKKPKRR